MDTEPTEPTIQKEPEETPEAKPNRTKLWVGLTALITALVVGGAVYAWQSSQATSDKTALTTQIADLTGKLASPSPTPTPSPSPSPSPSPTPSPTPSEDSIIVAAAIADAESNVSVTNATATIVEKSGTSFARVSVGLNPAGYSAILKRVNGIWVVVTRGQGPPSKADGATYGLPSGWYSTAY